MLSKIRRTGRENHSDSNGAHAATVVPYVRLAWIVDADSITPIETVCVVHHLESESSNYLARILGGVGSLRQFAAESVVFQEGDALRVRLLMKGEAKRRAEFRAQQERQCDAAIADLLGMGRA